MRIRCKMQLQEVRRHAGMTARTYVFRPQYDETIEEDRRFFKYSPTGEFTILVDNPAVFDHYEIGAFYYFDSVPVPVPEKAEG